MKKTKSILSIILSLVMLLAAVPLGAGAATPNNGSDAYAPYGDVISNNTYSTMTPDQIASRVLDFLDDIAESESENTTVEIIPDVLTIELSSCDKIVEEVCRIINDGVLGGTFDTFDVSALTGLKRSNGDLKFLYAILEFAADNIATIAKILTGEFDFGELKVAFPEAFEAVEGFNLNTIIIDGLKAVFNLEAYGYTGEDNADEYLDAHVYKSFENIIGSAFPADEETKAKYADDYSILDNSIYNLAKALLASLYEGNWDTILLSLMYTVRMGLASFSYGTELNFGSVITEGNPEFAALLAAFTAAGFEVGDCTTFTVGEGEDEKTYWANYDQNGAVSFVECLSKPADFSIMPPTYALYTSEVTGEAKAALAAAYSGSYPEAGGVLWEYEGTTYVVDSDGGFFATFLTADFPTMSTSYQYDPEIFTPENLVASADGELKARCFSVIRETGAVEGAGYIWENSVNYYYYDGNLYEESLTEGGETFYYVYYQIDEYFGIINDMFGIFDIDFVFNTDMLDVAAGYDTYGGLIEQLNNILYTGFDIFLTQEAFDELNWTNGGNALFTSNLEKLVKFALPKIASLLKVMLQLDFFNSDIFTAEYLADLTLEEIAVDILKYLLNDYLPAQGSDIPFEIPGNVDTLEAMAAVLVNFCGKLLADETTDWEPAFSFNYDAEVYLGEGVAEKTEREWLELCLSMAADMAVYFLNYALEDAAEGDSFIVNTFDFDPATVAEKKQAGWGYMDFLDEIFDWAYSYADGVFPVDSELTCERGVLDGNGAWYKLSKIINSILPLAILNNCEKNYGDETLAFDLGALVEDTILANVLNLDIGGVISLVEVNESPENLFYNNSFLDAALLIIQKAVNGIFPGTILAADIASLDHAVKNETIAKIATQLVQSIDASKKTLIPAAAMVARDINVIQLIPFFSGNYSIELMYDASNNCTADVYGYENSRYVVVPKAITIENIGDFDIAEVDYNLYGKEAEVNRVITFSEGIERIYMSFNTNSQGIAPFSAINVPQSVTEFNINGWLNSPITIFGYPDTIAETVAGYSDNYIFVDITTHEHDFDDVFETVDSTCTQAGYVKAGCLCGEIQLTELDKLEHSYVKGATTAPTCTAGGHTVYTCSGCSAVENRDITAALGHSDANGDGLCDSCGADVGKPPEQKESFLDKIKAFFQRIIDWFRNLFS